MCIALETLLVAYVIYAVLGAPFAGAHRDVRPARRVARQQHGQPWPFPSPRRRARSAGMQYAGGRPVARSVQRHRR